MDLYDYCGRGKVLVADDDLAIRELLSIRLGLLGYQVVTAKDGGAALAAVAEHKPDAVILDLAMPRLDGFGVLERLGRAKLASLPVLVLSGRTSAFEVQRAIRLGAKDYLAKPFGETQLLQRISRLTKFAPQFTQQRRSA
jgi:two-component system OmpR family response regulator